jgi:hypothetical protein
MLLEEAVVSFASFEHALHAYAKPLVFRDSRAGMMPWATARASPRVRKNVSFIVAEAVFCL